MTQEIEIEFKNLLTKNEFELLMKRFNITSKEFTSQENYYFDTVSFSLKDKHSALRIRKKQDKYILTLKQPHEQGLLETHQELTDEQAFTLLNNEGRKMVEGHVKEVIATLGINPNELQYLGALKTDRFEFIDNDNILVLDHSFYLNYEDYELEYEVKDPVTGKEKFLEILKQNNIPLRTTKHKIQRFFELKEKKED
ncbi:MAG TPA: CYTH domain-containing protein [Bacillales bacterium]|nr:CYTH domain-containing protein [Bacillales bacterium]